MIQPNEMQLSVPMDLSNGVVSTTAKVWEILVASSDGNIDKVKELVNDCPELIYAQYNYTPPIHFAVREGHLDLVKYLLDNGAHDPDYKTYPFLDSLNVIARDRGYDEIASLLDQYANEPARAKYKGDNGRIRITRSDLQKEFQKAVDKNDIERVGQILRNNPEFAHDENYFWGEGILMMPSKSFHLQMMELLMYYGARVPNILKWTQKYYFERFDSAEYLLEHGMNPDTMSWHHVTILHDMAQKGNIPKAELLIKHGAAINPIENEYQSTPLGLAVRWGHKEMVAFLLEQGADPNLSGARWSTPLTWAIRKGYNDVADILIRAGAK